MWFDQRAEHKPFDVVDLSLWVLMNPVVLIFKLAYELLMLWSGLIGLQHCRHAFCVLINVVSYFNSSKLCKRSSNPSRCECRSSPKYFVFVSISGNEAWGGVELLCFNAWFYKEWSAIFYTDSSRTVCVWRRFICPTQRADGERRWRGACACSVSVVSWCVHV